MNRYRYAAGYAQRTLERIAWDRGDPEPAAEHLRDALETFASIQARYFAGRAELDLGALAAQRGDPASAGTHLSRARSTFTMLGVPDHAERAECLAAAHGVQLRHLPA